MPANTWIRDYDPKRLRRMLAAFFLALALPTGALIWQAYDQLKFEAFYQYANQAEALAERIDRSLVADVNRAEGRRFTDFSFLNVAGDAPAKLLQRSPLAAYPVAPDVPGVLGYFQVGADGEFSTPLLPDAATPPEQVGISAAEYAARAGLAQSIQQILADNRLVRDRPAAGSRLYRDGRAAGAGGFDRNAAATSPTRPASLEFADDRPAEIDSVTDAKDDLAERIPGLASERESAARLSSSDDAGDAYTQQVFDRLNQPARQIGAAQRALEADETAAGAVSANRAIVEGKVDELRLDADLQQKNEAKERRLEEEEPLRSQPDKRSVTAPRARRVEQAALPETPPLGASAESVPVDGPSSVRISTFESEIDPYEFSLLDSGHLVLFRKVWRDGERYIQGLLIDRDAFLRDVVETAFRATTLSAMSDLVVGYQDDVVRVVPGNQHRSYPAGTGELEGSLLHRSSLSAPFEGLELVFSITRLPPGPAANVLAWTTVVIAIVFLAGFYALYRLGVGQIRLARQQQDFVSAVSHELKTPLTSIRMYGEMLKEGWADEDKRRQYYDYIHDESERLTRLITNVLQLAKITRSEPQFDLRPIAVGALMSQTESKIASQIERAGFRLIVNRDEATDRATIRIDDDCFAQIVINLVDNALKFSKGADPRLIEIGAATNSDGEVVFAVRDHGPGIPRDQMKKIFRLFYRTESELTRETVGTGIGLAIVHQLTVAMGGRIDVANRGPGAEFHVSFPIAAG